jgi:hypothetical protein
MAIFWRNTPFKERNLELAIELKFEGGQNRGG